MKKMLMVVYHFPPDAAIGAVRPAKFAKYLPEFGWEPIVYTLKERYYEGHDFGRLEPALNGTRIHRAALIPGPLQIYSKLKDRIRKPRVDTDPAATIVEDGESLEPKPVGRLKRLAGSLLRLPDEDQGWIFNVALGGRRIARKYKVDAVVTSAPPMSTHIGGALLKKTTGIRWVADFRDPWATSPVETMDRRDNFTRRLNERLESWVLRNADAVISTTDSLTSYFRTVVPREQGDKFLTIPNGFDEDDFKSLDGFLPRPGSKISIVFAGTIYLNRSPEPLFAALQALVSTGRISDDSIEIKLIGACIPYRGVTVQSLIAKYRLQGIVQVIDRVPYDVCINNMANANALLLFAQGGGDQIPAKVFDYLRINKPIFAIAEDGETKRMLEPFANAFIADPHRIEDIQAKFLGLIRRIGDGGKLLDDGANIDRYSRRELARQLSECLNR
jgi:glycosyltransferase involved in cell wall biosynthesis